MNKLLLIPLLLLAACQTNPVNTVVTDVDSQGNPMRISSPFDAETERVKAAERGNAEYYKAQAAKYQGISDGRDRALIAAIDALSPKGAPTNYNDTQIARSAASVEKHKAWLGFGKSVISGGLLGYGIGKAADVLSSGLDNAGDRSSTVLNADNGSTISGAVGEGNEYVYTEQTAPFGGIPLAEGQVEPIALGTPPEAVEMELNTCTGNGGTVVDEGTRCSDGLGGTIEDVILE